MLFQQNIFFCVYEGYHLLCINLRWWILKSCFAWKFTIIDRSLGHKSVHNFKVISKPESTIFWHSFEIIFIPIFKKSFFFFYEFFFFFFEIRLSGWIFSTSFMLFLHLSFLNYCHYFDYNLIVIINYFYLQAQEIGM